MKKTLLLFTFLFLGCKGILSAAPSLPEALLYNGRPIEGLCLSKFWLFGEDVNLKQCHEEIEKLDLKKTPTAASEFYGYSYEYQENGFTRHGAYVWQYLGPPSPGEYLIYADYNWGGTGKFSAIGLVKRKNENIVFVEFIDGGDRANGGIDKVVFKNKTLFYRRALTPAAMFDLGLKLLEQEKDFTCDIDFEQEVLASCSICYAADAEYANNFKTKKLLSVTLHDNALINSSDEERMQQMREGKSLQNCLDFVMLQQLKKGHAKLDLEAFKNLIQEVITLYKQRARN